MMPPDGNLNPMALPPRATPLPDQFPLTGPAPNVMPAAPGHRVSAAPQTPTLEALLQALKRRWIVALALAIAAAALTVVAVAVVFPPQYVTVARLELTSRPSPRIISTTGTDPEVDPAIFRVTQGSIIKSPLVLSQALNSENVKKLNIARRSPDALSAAIKVDFRDGGDIMTVKYADDDPENLADILNAVVAAYVKEADKRDGERRKTVVAQLDDSLARYASDLATKQADLIFQEKTLSVPDRETQRMEYEIVRSQQSLNQFSLRQLNSDIAQKSQELATKKAQLEHLETQPVSPASLKKLIWQSPAIQLYEQKLVAIDEEIAKVGAMFPATSSGAADRIQALRQEKQALNSLKAKTENELRPNFERVLRDELREKLENDILTLTRSLAYQNDQAKDMLKEQESSKAQVKLLYGNNREGGLAVQKLRDDIELIKETLKSLSTQVAFVKAEPTVSSRISVLQQAETPTERDYARLLKYGGAGGMGVFCLVLFGVAFLEFRSGKVNRVDDVTQSIGLPLVGTLPHVPASARRSKKTGSPSKRTAYWQSIITESVDAIRAQLVHASRTSGMQVVMVTSASGGEGKTSLASQLAASLARSWRKTLLVDADLRNPAAHKLFDQPLAPGFSEVLRGETTAADAVKPTLLSRLWLMPAGHWDAQAIQALAQDNVKAFFDQLKEQYEFIVVDSCPVLPVADSLLLGQHVDGVILSVLKDVSRVPSLTAAQQKLQGVGARTLGAVVIGTDGDPGSLAYRYVAQVGS
jgi:polysaccharide biosynthesis transport protein